MHEVKMSRLLVIALLGMSSCSSSPERLTIAMQPIDGETSIAAWTEGSTVHLGRIGVSNGFRWERALDGPVRELRVQGERIVVVREVADEAAKHHLVLEAFSILDGASQWRTSLGSRPGYAQPRLLVRPRALLDVIDWRASATWVTQLDGASGALRSEVSFEDLNDRVVFSSNDRVILGSGSVAVVTDEGKVSRDDGPASRCAMRRETPRSAVDECNTYDDRAVLFSRTRLIFADDDPPSVLELGPESELSRTFLAEVNEQGPLPRFLPILRSSGTLTLVDLEKRIASWTKTIGVGRTILRQGSRWYVTGGERLTMIDGEKGTMIRTLLRGAAPLTQAAFAGGVLWLHAAKGVAVGQLDPRTLEARFLPPSIQIEVEPEGEL